ncbi:MAG: hypothetical protein J6P45_06905 [Lachnospiraceae bacterium]|nr:hypothetical protein [Lachnospiraceae bacterium]MBR1877326.1 hypothetical protein [Lachnospiraceae bacterium]
MVNNDYELFCTTNHKVKDQLVSRLVKGGISYLEKWEKIPFFKRRDYNGAKELCVIYVNGNQWEQALIILDEYNEERGVKKRREKDDDEFEDI